MCLGKSFHGVQPRPRGSCIELKQNLHLIMQCNGVFFSVYLFHSIGVAITGLESGILCSFDQVTSFGNKLFSCFNKGIFVCLFVCLFLNP